jgi:hypothetical protein
MWVHGPRFRIYERTFIECAPKPFATYADRFCFFFALPANVHRLYQYGTTMNEETQTPVFGIEKQLAVVISVLAVALLVWIFSTKKPDFIKDGLVAYYPFNCDAKDESGNGRDGKVNGAEHVKDGHGAEKGAFFFNGNSSISIKLENVNIEKFTYSMWVKMNEVKKDAGWMTFCNLSTSNSDRAGQDSFSIGFGSNEGTTRLRLHTKEVTADTLDWLDAPQGIIPKTGFWTHCLCTFDGLRGVIFFNGKKIADNRLPLGKKVISGFFDIGTHRASNNSFLANATIDNVRIYSRALSVEEVKALYEYEKAE